MDLVTTAVIAAVATGLGNGTTDVAKKVIVDGYEGLKALLKNKFGNTGEIAKALGNLESAPGSRGRQQTLAEEMENAKVYTDPEVLAAAQALLTQIDAQPGGRQNIQTITGSYIAANQGSGTASVHIAGLAKQQNGCSG